MAIDWRPVNRMDFRKLREARLQAHHAVQWLARAARGYIPAKPDDSHTNLGWDPALGGLTTHRLPDGTRIGLGLSDLTLSVLNAGVRSQMLPLGGRTDAEVRAWLGQQLTADASAGGLDALLPYDIPKHDIDSGGRYNATELAEPLRMLANWYADANALLGQFQQKMTARGLKAPPVRCWPHHFDLDTPISLGRDRGMGLGFSPGDEYCDEPYFYVTIYPEPKIPELPLLPPVGHWHSHEFVAAFAPAHKVVAAKDQAADVAAFFDVAIDAGLKALRKS
jgi:hypothetical protein